MIESAREFARGRWAGLLGQWLDERALKGRHTGCPKCGGKDRFRFDDKGGAGTWFCNNCGAGDGFQLLEILNDWDFSEAARYVERNAGRMERRKVQDERSLEDNLVDLRRMWEGGHRIEAGDPVWRYLSKRCDIDSSPSGIRYHPSIVYLHDDGKKTHHPAMLAQVVGSDGVPVSIHRTYLTESGEKADVHSVKKLMRGVRKLENIAIRLSRPTDGWLGIAEGIETALCASKTFGIPVWACVSSGLMESFRPPHGITLLTIFGDNDLSFTGQASAYSLAKEVSLKGIECQVQIPNQPGDWADFNITERINHG